MGIATGDRMLPSRVSCCSPKNCRGIFYYLAVSRCRDRENSIAYSGRRSEAELAPKAYPITMRDAAPSPSGSPWIKSARPCSITAGSRKHIIGRVLIRISRMTWSRLHDSLSVSYLERPRKDWMSLIHDGMSEKMHEPVKTFEGAQIPIEIQRVDVFPLLTFTATV